MDNTYIILGRGKTSVKQIGKRMYEGVKRFSNQ